MITLMRRYRKILQISLLGVIAAFVASLFVFGTSSNGGGGDRRDAVAVVNGESIPYERYQRRYQAYLDAYAQVYRDRFNPQLAERLGLPQQVVNDLVQEAVVVQRARAEGLEVTDEELNAQIQAVPAFQEGGRFSLKRYQEFLKRRGLSDVAFEHDVRRELTRMKVEGAVKGGVKVSDAELERAFAARREEIRAAWALVEVAPLITAATASDEELEAYLKQHSLEFRQPERRKIQYVSLAPRDFTKAPTDAEVEKYYTEHPAEFEVPRQVRAAHVLARVAETGGSEAEDKAKARIADVIRRAKAGEDFTKLAREMSEDPGSAQNGGDLGYVGKGEVVPQFEQALLSLKKGEISPEPVRTPFGFHAIRVVDIKEGGKKSLKEASAQIRDRLTKEAAEKAARAKADEVRPVLQAANDFMSEAKRLGLTPSETTISRREPNPLGGIDAMEEAAFELAQGGVSTPVNTPAGFVVMKSVETMAAGVPPLGEIRDKVVAAVKRQKAETVALERAKQIAAEAKTGDLAAAARKTGAAVGETPRFSRAKPAERLPGDAMLAALETPAGSVSAPVKTQQGVYVLKVLERVPADLAQLAPERAGLEREVLGQKQSQVWESWINEARAGAKIEVFGGTQRPARRG